MEPRYNLRSRGNGPEEPSALHTTPPGRGGKKPKLAGGAQQLLPLLEDKVRKLAGTLRGTKSHAAATADLLASLRKAFPGTSTLPPSPPSFPLLLLPNEVVAHVCRMDPDITPPLRLTCQALQAAVPVRKLCPIQSPDLPVAAYQKLAHRPARLAPLVELDLTRAGGFVHSLVLAAVRHSPALQSIAVPDTYQLAALAHMPKLTKLAMHGGCLAVGRSTLSPLTNLKGLRSVSMTGRLWQDQRKEEMEGFSLLSPILALSELTCLELDVSWDAGKGNAAPTAASVPLISAGLPKLTRLGLPPAMCWDEASLAHLATLTGLTALSIGHNSAGGMAPYSSFFRSLAALPRLADIILHLQSSSSSSLRALPALLQRTGAAPCPLRSLTLTIPGGSGRFSDITQHLGAAPFLTHLSVNANVAHILGCPGDLLRLATSLPALRSLGVRCVMLHGQAIAQLSNLAPLTALTLLLSNCSVSRASSALGHLRSLQSLTTDLVQQQGLAAIGQLTSLTSLVLHGMQGGAEGLQHLSQLKRLRYLEFAYSCYDRYDPLSVEDPGLYAALVHLTALQQCRHPSWGCGMEACSFDDIQRRYIAKRPVA